MGNLLFGVLAILAVVCGVVEWWLVCGLFLGMAVAVVIGDMLWRRKMGKVMCLIELMQDKYEKAEAVGLQYFGMVEHAENLELRLGKVIRERDMLTREVVRVKAEVMVVKGQQKELEELCAASQEDIKFLVSKVEEYCSRLGV